MWWGWLTVVCGLLAVTFWNMVCLHPYQYVFFNRLFAGGVQQASEQYETDYWNHGHKEGADWLQAHATQPPGRKIRVASVYPFLHRMLDPERFELVQEAHDADYYLGATRFDWHRVLPGEVLHVVKSCGAPLLYVIRPDARFNNDLFFAGSPFLHYYRGVAYEGSGKHKAAIAAFQKALTLVPKKGRRSRWTGLIYVRLGKLYFNLGRYAEAAEYFRTALDLELNDPSITVAVYNNVGRIYGQLEDYDAALSWLQKAIRMAPYSASVYESLGDLYQEMGQNEKALEAFQKAVELKPDQPDTYNALGKIYLRLGRQAEAKAAFERAKQLKIQ